VREVETRDIEAGADKLTEDLRSTAGRAEGGDDFGTATALGGFREGCCGRHRVVQTGLCGVHEGWQFLLRMLRRGSSGWTALHSVRG
jgi:hypothetical protein